MSADGPSYWHLANRRAPLPALTRSRRSGIVVVGGGITGLTAAIRIRSLGYLGDVSLFERATVGAGATGRCGGVIYVDDGYLPGSSKRFVRTMTWLRALGLSDLVEEHIVEPANVVGEYDAALIDPQRLVSELTELARCMAITVYEGSEVTQWEEGTGGVQLRVNRFDVEANAVLFATDAYSPERLRQDTGLETWSEECVVVETRSRRLPWMFTEVLDVHDDFVWGRRLPPNRFLFGGGRRYSIADGDPERNQSALLAALAKHVSVLEAPQPVVGWSGVLSRFRDGKGWRVEPLPGQQRLLFAAGFDGQGLLSGTVAGLEAAAHLVRLAGC